MQKGSVRTDDYYLLTEHELNPSLVHGTGAAAGTKSKMNK
jgi:hypothetical protein